jgi:hypothetical protein
MPAKNEEFWKKNCRKLMEMNILVRQELDSQKMKIYNISQILYAQFDDHEKVKAILEVLTGKQE